MQRPKRSSGSSIKFKKKMTKEEMQLAIIKKKECDSKALKIVEQLLEPRVNPEWLVDNLKHLNRCHMEDAIEERAIIRICGYVLCEKPLTHVVNQKYHISLKSNKVYDITKRKNFCSAACFGASNYLLEQMLTSPLWLRDKEEVPTFKIFSQKNLNPSKSHGEEVNIALIEHCEKENENDAKIDPNSKPEMMTDDAISGNIQDFVYKTVKNIDFKDNVNDSVDALNGESNKFNNDIEQEIKVDGIKEEAKVDNNKTIKKKEDNSETKADKKERLNEIGSFGKAELITEDTKAKVENSDENDESDVIEQRVYPVHSCNKNEEIAKKQAQKEMINVPLKDTNQSSSSLIHDNSITNKESKEKEDNKSQTLEDQIEKQGSKEKIKIKTNKSEKLKRKKNSIDQPASLNLAARIEQSFQEWITEETIDFLFGEDTIKQKAIEKIEQQDKYSILCRKLNKLQFEDEEEDAKILEKPVLKPAPHFAVLQEEGQKLDIKVRAFYQGKTTFEEPQFPAIKEEEKSDSNTFLPLTETHAPQNLRRRIFLDKLDQVLPDLLRTLAGNNEVYEKVSVNYTSVRSSAVKALIHTFSLSAKNIIFKTAEWTLVGLVIIKMLSLLDPWLATLLLTKQANMYISMILTSYKLDPHYLNLLVNSYNPNMNPKS